MGQVPESASYIANLQDASTRPVRFLPHHFTRKIRIDRPHLLSDNGYATDAPLSDWMATFHSLRSTMHVGWESETPGVAAICGSEAL